MFPIKLRRNVHKIWVYWKTDCPLNETIWTEGLGTNRKFKYQNNYDTDRLKTSITKVVKIMGDNTDTTIH